MICIVLLEIESDTSFAVESSKTIPGFSATGVGVTLTHNSQMYLTGESILVNTFDYDYSSGIATITTNQMHGLSGH